MQKKKDPVIEEVAERIAKNLYTRKILEDADFYEKQEKILYQYLSVYGNLKDGERIKGVSIVDKKSKKRVVVEYTNNSWEFYTKEFSYDEVMDDAICIRKQILCLKDNITSMLIQCTFELATKSEENPNSLDLTSVLGLKDILQRVKDVNWSSFLSQKQLEEITSLQTKMIELAKKCGISLEIKDYEYEEPSLRKLKEKENIGFNDLEYLRVAGEYLKSKKLEITNKKFMKLSLDKKIEIACSNILYSDVMCMQLRVVKESKHGKRVKDAEVEENQARKRKQNEIIDKIFSGEEMTDEAISKFIHGMSNYSDYYNQITEDFARPYLLEDINKKVRAVEILKQKYPGKMNYDYILVGYKNWQETLSTLFQYFTASNDRDKEEASCNLFLYTNKKRKEQLEILDEYTKKYKGMDNQYREVSQKFDYLSTKETLETGIRVLGANLDWDAERRQKAMQEDLTFIKKVHNAISVSEKLQRYPDLTGGLLYCEGALEAYVSAKDITKKEENSHAISRIVQVLNEQIESFEEKLPSELIAKIQTDKVGVPKQLLKGIGKR